MMCFTREIKSPFRVFRHLSGDLSLDLPEKSKIHIPEFKIKHYFAGERDEHFDVKQDHTQIKHDLLKQSLMTSLPIAQRLAQIGDHTPRA
jgi:hypothetical protein